MEIEDNLRINRKDQNEESRTDCFSKRDYFISISHLFAIEWKGRKFIKNSNSFHFLNQVLHNHSDQNH